ncbi:MAG: helix-turn-helix domain-containing protein [Bacteroidetes bacterium]|nr:helix-turn-helix domain-containing protein [Bacteroidota bacterium]
MQKENLYQPFEIAYVELDECPKGAHKHNFFELAYIIDGRGRQCINQSKFAYRAGHLFLLTPEDCHYFEVEERTRFLFIRFADIYIRNGVLSKDGVQKLEFILQNANHEPGCILKNKVDKGLVQSLVEAIVREHVNHDVYNKDLIQQLVNTLIVVVARNIAKYLPDRMDEKSEEKALDILQYIQANIYSPEKISATAISGEFGISVSYLGRYFKKHAGETMQDYVMRYKLRLIEHRLVHSDLRINEIAAELGFTDESHLNRMFKKFRGVSPTAFRKGLAAR